MTNDLDKSVEDSFRIWNQSLRIMLVDDDEDDYLIIRDIVEEIQHQDLRLDWVSDFDQALADIQSQKNDVYLVDFRLGARDGLQLIESALACGCEAPLILLTGQDDFETDAKAMQLGAADYLVKSQITADLLDRSIRYSLKQSWILKEIRKMNMELESRVAGRTADLARVVDELRTSQQLYSSIANQFPHGFIMVLDQKMHFVLLDGQDLKRLGIKGEQYIGKHATILVHGEKQGVMEYYLHRVMEGESLTFELDINDHSYSFKGTPLFNSYGEIDQILLACINITQQKRVELEIRKALNKEKQLNELKSRFIAMASHEFRTPLSAIMSSISLISRYQKTEEQEKRDKHINRIKSNVANLTGILDDFLSLSKLEEGKVDSSPVQFDLFRFLMEATEEMQAVAKAGQDMEVDFTGEREVLMDKRLLKNIMINLLSNATKYSHPNTKIHVKAEVSHDYIRIKVQDHGIGIPDEEQVHLFERFYRACNATNIQGTGLGLNIVQKYVSLMGGNVEFESILGEGTTFQLIFPQVQVSNPD